MKKLLMVLLISMSAGVAAQQPAYVYKDVGFSPEGYKGGALPAQQQSDLDDCVAVAKGSSTKSTKDVGKLSQTYGKDMSGEDFFGVVLTGCLTDVEHGGKGWKAYRKSGADWRVVKGDAVAESFLKK